MNKIRSVFHTTTHIHTVNDTANGRRAVQRLISPYAVIGHPLLDVAVYLGHLYLFGWGIWLFFLLSDA